MRVGGPGMWLCRGLRRSPSCGGHCGGRRARTGRRRTVLESAEGVLATEEGKKRSRGGGGVVDRCAVAVRSSYLPRRAKERGRRGSDGRARSGRGVAVVRERVTEAQGAKALILAHTHLFPLGRTKQSHAAANCKHLSLLQTLPRAWNGAADAINTAFPQTAQTVEPPTRLPLPLISAPSSASRGLVRYGKKPEGRPAPSPKSAPRAKPTPRATLG